MICHICQGKFKSNQGKLETSSSDIPGSYWICKSCSPAKERVFEMEQLLRRLADRFVVLEKTISPEPWMVILADESFQPTFPNLKAVQGALTDLLWRKME